MLQSGHGRKTDGIDAHSVAIVAQHRGDLTPVSADDHIGVLRLLSDRRDELTAERRRAVNRLHRLLRDLRPGGAPLRLSADRAAQLLATIKPSGAVDIERKAMARQLIADVRRIDRALIDNRHRCAQAVAASATTLTDVFGISDVLAAKILGHTGDIARFASADHYASYTPTAPTRSPAASRPATASPEPATDRSTTPCTSPPACRPCTPDPAAPTTSANEPNRRPPPKPSAASNANSPRSSTATSTTTTPAKPPTPQP